MGTGEATGSGAARCGEKAAVGGHPGPLRAQGTSLCLPFWYSSHSGILRITDVGDH